MSKVTTQRILDTFNVVSHPFMVLITLFLAPSVFTFPKWTSLPYAFVTFLCTAVLFRIINKCGWKKALLKSMSVGSPVFPGDGRGGKQAVKDGLRGAAEELFFRGLLQPLIGIVPAAFLFGLIHNGWLRESFLYVLFAIVYGLIMGVAYWLTGDIWVPVLVHYTQNALAASPEKREETA